MPLIPIIIALIIDSVKPDSDLAPQYGLPQCWLNSAYGIYIYFIIPLTSMFVTNLVIFIVIIVKFSILAYQSRHVRTHHREKVILTVKLIFAFGLLWVFGILSAIFPQNGAIACIFIFVNSSMGTILCVVFLMNRSVINATRKHWEAYQHRRSQTKDTSTTTARSTLSDGGSVQQTD